MNNPATKEPGMKKMIMSLILLQATASFASVSLEARRAAAEEKVEEIEIAEQPDFTEISIRDSFLQADGSVLVTSLVLTDDSGQGETSCFKAEFEKGGSLVSLTRLNNEPCR